MESLLVILGVTVLCVTFLWRLTTTLRAAEMEKERGKERERGQGLQPKRRHFF